MFFNVIGMVMIFMATCYSIFAAGYLVFFYSRRHNELLRASMLFGVIAATCASIAYWIGFQYAFIIILAAFLVTIVMIVLIGYTVPPTKNNFGDDLRDY